jgi:Domain of unknown function (DUF5666)
MQYRPTSRLGWIALSLPLLCSLSARAAVPNIAGAVTAAVSATDFEVNGLHVVCDARTKFELLRPTDAGRISWSEKPYIGEPLLIYGHKDGHAHLFRAHRVVFAPVEGRLRGKAIIDRMLAPQPSGALLIRADGYPILLTASTQINFVAPLHSLADVHTNLWIEYQGEQRADGIVVAEKAVLRENTIQGREEKLRANTSYDPSAPPPGHQKDIEGGVQRLLAGHDPSEIPPSPDNSMQNRIDAIGQKLVPEYQRALPDGDPGKIPFHFQLVEKKEAASRIDLPSGTILVPRQIVARLQNDDQIAAYLAAGMAAILEKQRLLYARKKLALDAAAVGVLAVTPLGLPLVSEAQSIETAESEQRMRISLALLHDAGYNLIAVPETWWLLASKKPKRLIGTSMPDESIYAYVVIGSTWRHTSWQ